MRPIALPVILGTLAVLSLPTVLQAQDRSARTTPGITLSQAIKAAEDKAEQGRTVEAELEERDGVMVYEVTILRSDGADTVVVDAGTGKVLSTKDEGLIGELLEYRPAPAGGETPMPLSRIVEMAENAVKGRAVEAEVERSWRGDRVEVELMRGNDKAEVELSALTGEILDMD